jgi:hypothetical protein
MAKHLHQVLAELTEVWRRDRYFCADYPAIGEIIDWSLDSVSGQYRFLRRPQVRALETYWYLRLVEGTPHVLDLYRKFFARPSELLESLGPVPEAVKTYAFDNGLNALFERIKTDDQFVRSSRLESLRETLTLDYASYILALTMGSGKTILIGSIVATEFAMAMEYPDGPFVQNALIFAPGTTIIESLRELAEIPYDRILPPRLYKPFAASVKLTFTREGEKDIPVIRGSNYNVVVTNTEKIRIQKETIRKSDIGTLFDPQREEEARSEVANLRLQAIASLPHLAVFSDEAHHTYGQSLDSELKKVRKTVDYLAANTSVVAVINTTGTPYFRRQALKDVVTWYGLSQGIADGYLKELAGNIHAYDFAGNAAAYVAHVVVDFFKDYGDVCLPNGAAAKLAIYFPQTDDLRELRPTVDLALAEAGQSPAVCVVNTSDESITKSADIDAFNRLNDPSSPHRVILLVNKGTEGWNCPSLFACALARKLRTSNNFVLQAATRCLRQVPGNTKKARVYLSIDNYKILDRQLQETYGESVSDLRHAARESARGRIKLRKLDIPPLVVTQIVRTVVKKDGVADAIRLDRPAASGTAGIHKHTYTLAKQQATARVLREIGLAETIDAQSDATDAYAAAVDLAANYRLDLWQVYDELRRTYGKEEIPLNHLDGLAEQIERQTRPYEVREERVEVALALVRPEGFDRQTEPDGTTVYTAEITYPKDRESLLLSWQQMVKQNGGDFGFHYDPYNFDSNPEKSFFEELLVELNLRPEEIEDIYFTGALTDPAKTDFYVQYKDQEGNWHNYTPDFVIRKKPPPGRKRGTGRTYVIEIKRERDRQHPVDGENGKKALAMRKWEDLNPERLKYEMIFTALESVSAENLKAVREFVKEQDR